MLVLVWGIVGVIYSAFIFGALMKRVGTSEILTHDQFAPVVSTTTLQQHSSFLSARLYLNFFEKTGLANPFISHNTNVSPLHGIT